MSTGNDPYVKWLGIRDPQRPPNHYRLLGVELFESDSAVIESAADRQMAHVRTYQSGPNGAISQRILNEIAAAKLCLLDPNKRAAYERVLRAHLAARGTTGAATGAMPGTPMPPAPMPGAGPIAAGGSVAMGGPVATGGPVPAGGPRVAPRPAAQAGAPGRPMPAAGAPQMMGPQALGPQVMGPRIVDDGNSSVARRGRRKSSPVPMIVVGLAALAGVGVAWYVLSQPTPNEVAKAGESAEASTAQNTRPAQDGNQADGRDSNVTNAGPKGSANSDSIGNNGDPSSVDSNSVDPTSTGANTSTSKKIGTTGTKSGAPGDAATDNNELASPEPKSRPTVTKPKGRPTATEDGPDVGRTTKVPVGEPSDMPSLPERKPRPTITPDGNEPESFEDIVGSRKLTPVPSDENVAAAKARVRDVFSDLYAKSKKPEDRMKLATELFNRGSTTTDNLDDRYAMLDEARGIAEDLGEFNASVQAIDELGKHHAIKVAEMKVHAYIEAAKKLKTPAECADAVRIGLNLANQIAGENDVNSCDKLAKYMVLLAGKSRDNGLVQQSKELVAQFASQRKLVQDYQEAVEKLKTMPDDPAANLAVGIYKATARDDLAAAIRHFIKSGDERLKAIALAEEGRPSDSDPAIALADDWRAWSEDQPTEIKIFALRRAKYWNEFATVSASGLKKVKAEKDADDIGRQITALLAGAPAISSSPIAKPKGEIAVLEAKYGSGANVNDVTMKVAALVRNGRLLFSADNAFFGDPAFGAKKHFLLRVRVNGTESVINGGEGEVIYLNARLQGARATKNSPEVYVHEAFWGGRDQWVDLTGVVREYVKSKRNDSVEQVVSRQVRTDVAVGSYKALVITYEKNGKISQLVLDPNKPLVFP